MNNKYEQLLALQKSIQSLIGKETAIIVSGGQWGDEGKGKVIDLLASNFDILVRFSGGCNAGHTTYTIDDPPKKVVSHMIPCGAAQNKTCVIGRGAFFDLERFINEYKETVDIIGINPTVYIDEGCPVWTSWHAELERWFEDCRENQIGTTGRAIGLIAAIRDLRCGIVVADLFRPRDELVKALTQLYRSFYPLLEEHREKTDPDKLWRLLDPDPEEEADKLLAKAPLIESMVKDTSYWLDDQLSHGQKVIAEGAQATGLDIQWGTVPYVSAGNSCASGAELGTGIPAFAKAARILVMKALPTRVGDGPFPSEIWNRSEAEQFPKKFPELFEKGEQRDMYLQNSLARINESWACDAECAQYFQVLGDELGATTKRGRSIGDLDIPWMLYAIRINKPDFLCLTRFDMLSGLDRIHVVENYLYNDEELPPGKLPYPKFLGEVVPFRRQWTGIKENISGCSKWEDLPGSAQHFVLRLQELLGVPFLMLGTGPGRADAIVGPFEYVP